MKNKKKSIAIIATALAATAACGTLAVLGGMPILRKDVADSTSTSLPGEGGMTAAIEGGPKFAAQVNSTKTCTATISPANATDKTILWATSDAAKVSIASATTQSGANQTLTLVSVFNGNVTITATAEANASAKVTFSVSVYNFVTNLSLVGFGEWDGEALTSAQVTGLGIFDSSVAAGQSGYIHMDNAHLSWDASGKVAAYANDTSSPCYNFALLEGKGRDTSIAPDIAAAPSGFLMNAKDATTFYFAYQLPSSYSEGPLSFSVEDGSCAITLATYVAPASMTGSGNVQFK